MTTIYLIRHSEPMRDLQGELKTNDSLLEINLKFPLGVCGEKFAEKIAENSEFDNLDAVWASNYVRAMATAKYFAFKNNVKVNVDDRFGERVQGILKWGELPEDYNEKLFLDENYRWRNGESQKEVTKRMKEALFDVLKNSENKRVAIVSHATALTFLLKSLCDVTLVSGGSKLNLQFSFNDKVIYQGNMNFCETFKLEFDGLNLCLAKHIETDF